MTIEMAEQPPYQPQPSPTTPPAHIEAPHPFSPGFKFPASPPQSPQSPDSPPLECSYQTHLAPRPQVSSSHLRPSSSSSQAQKSDLRDSKLSIELQEKFMSRGEQDVVVGDGEIAPRDLQSQYSHSSHETQVGAQTIKSQARDSWPLSRQPSLIAQAEEGGSEKLQTRDGEQAQNAASQDALPRNSETKVQEVRSNFQPQKPQPRESDSRPQEQPQDSSSQSPPPRHSEPQTQNQPQNPPPPNAQPRNSPLREPSQTSESQRHPQPRPPFLNVQSHPIPRPQSIHPRPNSQHHNTRPHSRSSPAQYQQRPQSRFVQPYHREERRLSQTSAYPIINPKPSRPTSSHSFAHRISQGPDGVISQQPLPRPYFGYAYSNHNSSSSLPSPSPGSRPPSSSFPRAGSMSSRTGMMPRNGSMTSTFMLTPEERISAKDQEIIAEMEKWRRIRAERRKMLRLPKEGDEKKENKKEGDVEKGRKREKKKDTRQGVWACLAGLGSCCSG